MKYLKGNKKIYVKVMTVQKGAEKLEEILRKVPQTSIFCRIYEKEDSRKMIKRIV